MFAVVDEVHEFVAGRFNVSEGVIFGPEVGVFRDDVGLGELHGGLDTALGRGVRRLAGEHRDAVVTGEVHRRDVAHRDAGDVGHGDGFLVIGQDIGRGATDDAERAIQRRVNTRRRAITHHDHDPEPRPRQPGNEENGLLAVHNGAVAEIVLNPHTRLRDPRPVHPGVAEPVGGAHLGERASGRAVRARVAESDQFRVGDVGAQLALGRDHPFLELGHERVRDPATVERVRQRLASIAGRDVAGDGVVGAPRQLCGAPQRLRQIIRSENFHDFYVYLH